MKHADFIHLVRMSEHASEENPQGYRRNVALFAALGYAWVIVSAMVALSLLVWALYGMTHGRFRSGWIWLTIFALSLLWASLRALWLRLEPPTGQIVTRDDAPLLFEALEKIRKQIKGPPIHHVVLNDEFNASISQYPRYGLFGGAVNYLTLGLPLMMSVERTRFLAILAHEYGHLRGDHGVLGAWVYRTRVTWLKLYHHLRHDGGIAAAVTQGFFAWYFPRFSARSFALARQDEYEADKLAARLLGAPVFAAALSEMHVKGAWLAKNFWATHWQKAAEQSAPIGPYRDLIRLLPLPPMEDFAQTAFRDAVKSLSDVDDTHPVLRDRLTALDQPTRLPTWSARSSLPLLGPRVNEWVLKFDQQWCRDNANEWKQYHAYLGRMRSRVDALVEAKGRNNANEMVELAELTLRLNPKADVRAYYERALAVTPDHGAALRGLVKCLGNDEHAQRMRHLETLFDSSVGQRYWACNQAVELLEPRVRESHTDEEGLKLWRDRFKHAEAAERRAWQEHSTTPYFVSIARDDLSDYEKGEFRNDLTRIKMITRAWLVCKNLREFPQRRCYTLFVDLPGLDDESRYDLCRRLERTLNLPGHVLVLWVGESPSLREIEQHGLHPTFMRPKH